MPTLTGRELKGLRADLDVLGDLANGLAAWLERRSAAELDRESVLPGWTVRDLARHLVIAVRGVAAAVDQPSRQAALPMGELVRRYRPAAAEIAERARSTDGPDPTTALRSAAGGLWILSGWEGPWPATVLTPRGPGRLRDFVRTRIVDLVVHADDLARTFPDAESPDVDRKATAVALRTLTTILGEQSPGRSVEVRIPPYAAVQCGLPGNPGPTHTRGTPPNVVETDATTFLRLATGRTTWAEALPAIRASGERADLTTVLPVL